MAKFIKDKDLWDKIYLTLPQPPYGDTIEEATINVGNCVKSLEREKRGFPKFHGRLAEYTDNQCVVVSHIYEITGIFVWIGSKQEYHDMWTVD